MRSDFRAWLDAAGYPQVDKLYCSRLIRAQQTAAMLAQHECAGRPEICSALMPGAIPEEFADCAFDDDAHVVAVTHQPFLSRAIGFWSDDGTLAPLAPAGYTTLQVLSFERGGVTVLRHRPDPRDADQMGLS
jgi:phosphohistidine phosphatase SixA